MFKAGYFSSEDLEPCQVDSVGLKRLTVQQLAKGLQVTESNPIAGLEGRAGLLSRLGDALRNSALFGRDGRPGHMLGEYLHQVEYRLLISLARLPSVTSNNPSRFCSCSNSPNPLDSPYKRSFLRLARHTNTNRRSKPWRCLAMFFYATFTTRLTMGGYRTISQTYTMAMLFAYGSNEEDYEDTFRWHRFVDRITGI